MDIVLGHHASISAIATPDVARGAGKPCVLLRYRTGVEPRHEGRYDDRVWSTIEEAIRLADGILATTEHVRDRLDRAIRALLADAPRQAALAAEGRRRAQEQFCARELERRLEGWLASICRQAA